MLKLSAVYDEIFRGVSQNRKGVRRFRGGVVSAEAIRPAI